MVIQIDMEETVMKEDGGMGHSPTEQRSRESGRTTQESTGVIRREPRPELLQPEARGWPGKQAMQTSNLPLRGILMCFGSGTVLKVILPAPGVIRAKEW